MSGTKSRINEDVALLKQSKRYKAAQYFKKYSIWRFSDPYYLLNAAVVLSFPFLRHHFSLDFLSLQNTGGLSKEGHIWSILALYLLLKYIHSPNLDVFFSYVFLYTKATIVLVGFMCGDYSVCFSYGALFLALFLFVKNPEFDGPNDVLLLDPNSFRENILQSNSNIVWVVYMYATWCPPCAQISPIFSELSITCDTAHDHEVVKFAKIDVGRFEQVAKQFDVDTSTRTRLLPTIAMFRNGKMERRLPSLGQPMTSLGIYGLVSFAIFSHPF